MTTSGVVRGQTIDVLNVSIDQFLGIPYAELPVGRFRFAKPEPIKTPLNVRENSHKFGGDRDQITIFGESAGSWSVSADILSPLSKGLFKRAIMESGAHMYNKNIDRLTKSQALTKAKQFNCTETSDWLQCLRALNTDDLIAPELGLSFPLNGDQFLPLRAKKAFETMKYNHGVNTSSESALRRAFYDLTSHLMITCPTYMFAKQFARNVKANAHNVYFYQLTYVSQVLANLYNCDVATKGVCHATDLTYVFGIPFLMPDIATPDDIWFSRYIMEM
ncbi:unnamed protein product [Medioppia subpectinata]|uniref:Carboxylic ester hydrolase n=1 Tax=Medioppia subpectinata TaxID=1979941 RepID=A0A7R9KR36_9ACAR|nr:unnamed protein product [Medioppia subpectinata]CAG2107814.1 unnamed protein product [Medioppia subpectinata]